MNRRIASRYKRIQPAIAVIEMKSNSNTGILGIGRRKRVNVTVYAPKTQQRMLCILSVSAEDVDV